MVSVGGAEGPAVVVVALAVAQSVARVARVFPRCQPVPTTSSILVRWAPKVTEDEPCNISANVLNTFQFSFSFLRAKYET